jgi:hypothetical protein
VRAVHVAEGLVLGVLGDVDADVHGDADLAVAEDLRRDVRSFAGRRKADWSGAGGFGGPDERAAAASVVGDVLTDGAGQERRLCPMVGGRQAWRPDRFVDGRPATLSCAMMSGTVSSSSSCTGGGSGGVDGVVVEGVAAVDRERLNLLGRLRAIVVRACR